jgi:adenylate cyclase
MKKRDVYKIIFLICFYVSCAIFITFYDSAVLKFKSEITGEPINLWQNLLTVILVTIVGSSLLGTLEVLILNRLFRKRPLGIALLIKSTIYLIFIIFFMSTAFLYLFSTDINKPLMSKEVWQLYLSFLFSPRIIMTLIYWGIACMLALFILQVNEKFGQGILINFLLGKYHRPMEEKRIFMFMDLKSNTAS